ncbi:MAG: hypothetical protein LUG94_00215 [Ruminococcus sp.]|nr:hypothetical protein [Ruminococcus sp.]
MSKDNISLNDILEEFSPDGQKKLEQNNTNSNDNQPKEIPVEPPKTLEQLEMERLQAISKGELSDSAINYATFTNKPNKIIENPKKDDYSSQYYNKGVIKINSRPDRKEIDTDRHNHKNISYNHDTSTTSEHKKIDSRNDRAKLESSNLKKSYSKVHNDISNEDFANMSEKISKAKAKKQQQIDELNSKYSKNDAKYTNNDNSNAESTQVKKKSKTKTKTKNKDKKSLWNRIVDYYTFPVDDEESTSTNKVSKDTTSNLENTSTKETATTVENNNLDTPKQKESFKEFMVDLFTNKEKTSPRKKETFKERMIDFFTIEDDDENITNGKDDAKENSNITISSTDKITNTTQGTTKVLNDIDNLLNSLIDTPTEQNTDPKKDTPIVEEVSNTTIATLKTEEPIEKDTVVENTTIQTPIVDEDKQITEIPKVQETIKEEYTPNTVPNIVDIPKEEAPIETVTESKTIDTPIDSTIPDTKVVESTTKMDISSKVETPTAEPKEDTSTIETKVKEVQKKPNIFKRIKNFFLMEELSQMQDSNDGDEIDEMEEEKSLHDAIETIDNNTTQQQEDITSTMNNSLEDTKKVPIENIEVEKTSTVEEPKPVQQEETSAINEDNSITNTETTTTKNESFTDDDYIIPFSEETSDDAIDIPIEEPIRYKHFWQDPDFNPIDRFKSYVEETTEKHRNRKRSGEIHIEIKSTPDTSILFSNVEDGILQEQKIIQSREEFQQQVRNGEYDNYEETLNKVPIENDEHTFHNTSISDFNSYDDKAKVKEYISEMKTGLLVRIIVTSLISILSLYITLANDIGLPIFDTLNTEISATGYLMVQSAFGLVAILTSAKSIATGIVKIFKRKSDSDSFASIGIVSATITSIITFFMADSLVEEKMLNIYMPIALIGVLMNLIGKMLIIKREENNFKSISRDRDKFGMFCMQDDYNAEKITKGLVEDYPVTVYKKKSKFASDFIKYTYSYDMADRFSKFAIPIVSIVSLIVSVIASIVYNKSFDMVIPVGIVSIFSMLISFCSCFSITLYINSMLYDVSNRYAKRDGILLGYQAVEDFYDTNSIILNANDIFPKGSINISALKLFSNAKVDETLIYAISLAKKVNSILAPTLLDMLDGNFDMIRDVENCSYEDGLGICGWIDNKRVLMGNRELMELHNIENLPSKSKENELVGSKKDGIYISVSGNLALMLIIDIVPNKKIKQDLHSLENNRIAIAITSCDFLVSVNRINYLFGIDPDNVKVIPYELYQETKEYFTEKPKCSSSIVTNGDIGLITKLLVATKNIHRNSIIGNILHSVSCIVGIIIGISFISMGAFRELTPSMILLYNLICSAVTLLISKWKRF